MPTIGIMHSSLRQYNEANVAKLIATLKANCTKPLEILPTVWAPEVKGNLKQIAHDLVQKADLVVAAGGSRCAKAAIEAAKGSSKQVVFTSASDTAAYLNGPNASGVCVRSADVEGERLGLLLQIATTATKIGVLRSSNRDDAKKQMDDLQAAAGKHKEAKIHDADVNGPTTIKQAFEKQLAGVNALVVAADPFLNENREEIVDQARARKLPAIYQWREFVEAPLRGMMSYGLNLGKAYERAGKIAADILMGNVKPPYVWQPGAGDFELVINETTVGSLKLTIPQSLRDRAQVIK